MNNVFDIYTIIFLALAVFIFFRLRSVLGTKTGSERDPFQPRDNNRDLPPGARPPAQGGEVIPMPARNGAAPMAPPVPVDPAAPRWGDLALPGTPLARGFDAIASRDPSFDPAGFIGGAKAAYEMIVLAFAGGDRKMLRDLLAKDVFEGFEAAIRDRETRGEQVETRFVGIEKAEIVDAQQRGDQAQVTLKFVSQLVTATRDRAGAVIDGSPDRVTDVTDVWTFARNVTDRDPNWRLIATEAGG
ncbi:Tim44/TimA family putative adaptor protein [Bosea sp. (in: a-proteobacteria)]|uniref:Tim44/TimA family putative adaptor protein n=1 Tax=Bosea sp. (in: a-proteobacteria) TaxID=1871050 RepID=UPI00273276F0|nr:Tim44/TimA family putative adaptor protein [Bosea sp. (in: a-proteobacteria)]MDP3407328.1 Tim44/TimA family putative adaptor protein [Bosea sp. (in: a-proteobacteria)]